MKEVWKEIPGFSDYEISTYGSIRSKDRSKEYKSGRVMHLKSKVKRLRKHPKNDFLMTDLIDNNGKRRTVYPHKMVALAFIKNDKPRLKKIVIHKDGEVCNNHLENLYWATYSESVKLGFELGLRDNSDLWRKRRAKYGPQGSSKKMGRRDPLSEEDKKNIYELRKKNMKLSELAKKFNCSVSHIHKTIKNFEDELKKQ